MITKPIGLYLHVPFCVRKCNYCDFCSFPVDSVEHREEYISALCREIESYKGKNIHLDSIFFGGGTPTLLTVLEIERIVSVIKSSFVLSPDLEFTVEANPGTVNEEKLRTFLRHGMNRLSIGLQSIHENEMKILGRIHDFEDFLKTFELARKCGINNVNVDLMYGIPEQTMESFKATLQRVTELSPEHISLYGLILEEGTPLYEKRNSLPLPSEDGECDMYYFATDFLRNKGYSHYEISNYAKAGKECRHNLKYWRCEEYIGVGLAAYSYFDGFRFGNTENLCEYLKENYKDYGYREAINKKTLAYEFVMLGLRTSEGISLCEYREKFGEDFLEQRQSAVQRFTEDGFIRILDGRLSLTENGFYVSNYILTELI